MWGFRRSDRLQDLVPHIRVEQLLHALLEAEHSEPLALGELAVGRLLVVDEDLKPRWRVPRWACVVVPRAVLPVRRYGWQCRGVVVSELSQVGHVLCSSIRRFSIVQLVGLEYPIFGHGSYVQTTGITWLRMPDAPAS